MELSCPVQTYAWGKKGEKSAVATLKAASDSSFKVEHSTPYAELWMGTHPNGPAVIKGTEKTLKEVITADPIKTLGSRVVREFGDKDLPFLFKVLSVGKALSIQVILSVKTRNKIIKCIVITHYYKIILMMIGLFIRLIPTNQMLNCFMRRGQPFTKMTIISLKCKHFKLVKLTLCVLNIVC